MAGEHFMLDDESIPEWVLRVAESRAEPSDSRGCNDFTGGGTGRAKKQRRACSITLKASTIRHVGIRYWAD